MIEDHFFVYKSYHKNILIRGLEQGLDKDEVEKLCAIETGEERESYRNMLKKCTIVFDDLDDIPLISSFIRKFNLNAKFNHPMFKEHQKVNSNVAVAYLQNDIPPSKKFKKNTEDEQNSTTSKNKPTTGNNNEASTSNSYKPKMSEKPKKVNIFKII